MANTTEKTGNFLKAIEKYADEQKRKIESEVEAFKREELKKAEDEGLRDAYALIQKEITACKTKITSDLAKKEAENNKILFERREEIKKEVFDKAEQKLKDFTKTAQYTDMLTKSAKAMAEYFGNNICILYVKEDDKDKINALTSFFNGNATVKTDSKILIGGLRGGCENMGIVLDDTLDTKLASQNDWFLENSDLAVTSGSAV